MNKKTFNEMVAKKALLQGRLKTLQEQQRRKSVSYLIEDTIEKAEIVLAAKEIVDKIGKMAEECASIESDDLMPMIDSLKNAFGPGISQNFQSSVSDKCRALTVNLTATKDGISAEVAKLEAIANGQQPPNDMTSDPMNAPDDMSDMGDQPNEIEPAPDASDDLGDVKDERFAGPAGRAKKESVSSRGRALNEGLLDSIKSVLTAHFDDVTADRSPRDQLEALKPFITASDYEVASQFPDHLLGTIFDRGDAAVGMPDATPTETIVDPSVVPMTLNAEPMQKLKPSDIVTMDDSLDDDMDPDLHGDLDAEPLDRPFESAKSPGRRLRESKNPDAMIYGVFAKVVKEGVTRNAAARKVAETFGIDLSDVVSVIREAEEAKKPICAYTDWSTLYSEGSNDDMTLSALINFIADNTDDPRFESGAKNKIGVADYRSAIKAWLEKKNIKESAKQDAIFGKKTSSKKDCADDTDCDKDEKKSSKPWEKKDGKEKVDERVDPNAKKVGLDRHLERKAAAAKDKDGKLDPSKNPYGKKVQKVDEAEADKFEVVWINDKNKSQTNSFNTKEKADEFASDIIKGGAKASSVKTTQKVDEAEYNADAVNSAINSSNRSGRKVGHKEGKAIHALLKGRHGLNGDNGKPKAKPTTKVEESEKPAKPYYVVAMKVDDGKWGVHFGDFDKSVARQEAADEKDSAKSRDGKHSFKLITCDNGSQKTVNASIAKLNSVNEGESNVTGASQKKK